MIFDFNQHVTLKSVTFSLVDWNDEFRFFFQDFNTGDLVDYGTQVNIPGTGYATYVFSSLWTGTSFGIGARDYYDNFKVKGLHVAPVPLPAAAWLLLTALGGMGFLGWRRKHGATA